MVSVSTETAEQTEQRLRRVIAQADLVVHDGVWCFEEFPSDQPPAPSSSRTASAPMEATVATAAS
ncbi:DUF6196 family protein [Actinomadura nitritigenes]|uniref:DUF6196 family protein n=1 Tax=Actinomadura nitritigenes TaxID=134602 RepID=UPI003CD0C0F4